MFDQSLNLARKKTPPPEAAFVKAGTFRRALADFRRAAGLKVPDGSVDAIPGGGRSLHFNPSPTPIPWLATGGDGIRVGDGFICWGGRVMYFPAATYGIGSTSGSVMLKVKVVFTTVNNNPNPWDIVIDDSTTPEMTWESLGTIGTHARITNPAAETITTTEGLVYIPIASLENGRVIQHQYRHFSLGFLENGSLVIDGYWTTDA